MRNVTGLSPRHGMISSLIKVVHFLDKRGSEVNALILYQLYQSMQGVDMELKYIDIISIISIHARGRYRVDIGLKCIQLYQSMQGLKWVDTQSAYIKKKKFNLISIEILTDIISIISTLYQTCFILVWYNKNRWFDIRLISYINHW